MKRKTKMLIMSFIRQKFAALSSAQPLQTFPSHRHSDVRDFWLSDSPPGAISHPDPTRCSSTPSSVCPSNRKSSFPPSIC